MIQITPQMRILVALEVVDFRKGIDRLAQLCREVIGSDPFSGHVFVFRNRRKTAIKILCYMTVKDSGSVKSASHRGAFSSGLKKGVKQ